VLYSRVFIKLRREGFMGVDLSSVGCYHKLVSFCANKKEFKPLIYCIPACRFTVFGMAGRLLLKLFYVRQRAWI
jgi:hypothetical protein